jgi:hypothetical protein
MPHAALITPRNRAAAKRGGISSSRPRERPPTTQERRPRDPGSDSSSIALGTFRDLTRAPNTLGSVVVARVGSGVHGLGIRGFGDRPTDVRVRQV